MSDESIPVNRFASEPAWHAVDDYFTRALVLEDCALNTARESGADTTLPNAEVAANQGALLDLLVQIAGAHRIL